MKLRIRGNTVRLRLTRSEVDDAGSGRDIVEETQFPGGTVLRYRFSSGPERGAALSVDADGAHSLTITVPLFESKSWAEDETKVGLSGAEPFRIDELEVLVEKDFTCVTPREGEEELDTFPNPNIAAS